MAPYQIPDPVTLVDNLDPDEIAGHMDRLARQLHALHELHRAAKARRRVNLRHQQQPDRQEARRA